jgi:bacterioferritin (cytochrome b1)
MSDTLKKTFNELSKALQQLHKELLMLEAKKLEARMGKALGPYELLHASLNDPSLAWLRKMSELIVNIDTIIDETPNLSAQESHRVAAEVLNMLEKPAGLIATDFWQNYSEYLANNADIIMRHAKVKDIITQIRPAT